jgi:hypothetical protein
MKGYDQMTGRTSKAKTAKAAKAKVPTIDELREAEAWRRKDLAYRISDPDGLIGDDLPDDPDEIDAYAIRDFGYDLQADAEAWVEAYEALQEATANKDAEHYRVMRELRDKQKERRPHSPGAQKRIAKPPGHKPGGFAYRALTGVCMRDLSY